MTIKYQLSERLAQLVRLRSLFAVCLECEPDAVDDENVALVRSRWSSVTEEPVPPDKSIARFLHIYTHCSDRRRSAEIEGLDKEIEWVREAIAAGWFYNTGPDTS